MRRLYITYTKQKKAADMLNSDQLLQVCITWPILFVEACKNWTKMLITKVASFHTLVNRAEKPPITIFPGACIYTETNFFLNFLFNKTYFSTLPPQLSMKWLNCWYAFICLFHILNIFTSSKCEYQNWLEVCNLWKLLHVQKQDAIINIHIYIIIEP